MKLIPKFSEQNSSNEGSQFSLWKKERKIIPKLSPLTYFICSTGLRHKVLCIKTSTTNCLETLHYSTLLHPERPKLYTILAFLSATGLKPQLPRILVCSFHWCMTSRTDSYRIVQNSVSIR